MAQFRALKYKNSIGTDVVVEMPENHIWFGGADTHTLKGYKFIANIPTEEIYSLPKYNGVNGKIVSSYPLNYHGVIIEDFWFEFKDGVVVDYDAKTNKKMLTELLNTDKGSKRLGEIALVPYDSPISNTGLMFYNTLFDENASCHFALGESYPICIEGGAEMSEEELLKSGANVSDKHVDFMVGTSDLEITGITEDGTEIQIFLNGNFVI
jgi:aminopeptidase